MDLLLHLNDEHTERHGVINDARMPPQKHLPVKPLYANLTVTPGVMLISQARVKFHDVKAASAGSN